MGKLTLTDSWIYAGKHYGPGEVEIEDEDAYKAIKGKIDAAAKAKADTPAPLTDAEASQAADARIAARDAERAAAEHETQAANRATSEKRVR